MLFVELVGVAMCCWSFIPPTSLPSTCLGPFLSLLSFNLKCLLLLALSSAVRLSRKSYPSLIRSREIPILSLPVGDLRRCAELVVVFCQTTQHLCWAFSNTTSTKMRAQDFVLAGGMLFSGTINTIASKFQDTFEVKGLSGDPPHKFEHPAYVVVFISWIIISNLIP